MIRASARWRIVLMFLVLSNFLCVSNAIKADWNSGITIEDVSTRIYIDIVDQGVYVTADLDENAVTLLYASYTKESDVSEVTNTFGKNILSIATEDGLIVPQVKITGAGVEKAAQDLSLEIFFPFLNSLPKLLRISPVFKEIEKAGEKYMITVSHQGLPVIDHGVLTDTETLTLDWQDPWYSHFTNPKLKRGHSEPIMAFLYIKPQTIKAEIVVRVKEMAEWTDLGLRDDQMIYPDELGPVKQKIARYLLKNNVIKVDSKELSPALDRADYIRMGAADIQAYEPQQAQQQAATLLGVSLVQSIDAIPQKIQWQWNLFNEKIRRVAIRAYDSAGIFDSYVTSEYRIFEWENMLTDIDLPESVDQPKSVPVISDNGVRVAEKYVVLAVAVFLLLLIIAVFVSSTRRKYMGLILILFVLAAGYYFWKKDKWDFGFVNNTLNEKQVKPVLKQLLWNVYKAFESSQEEISYEQLANSVSGDLRETLYLQNRQAILVQDGAQSKVNEIEIKRLEQLYSTSDNQHVFECEWLVVGEVIHWGHQHRRENLYQAKIKIAPIKNNWKIIELESLGQQRVDAM